MELVTTNKITKRVVKNHSLLRKNSKNYKNHPRGNRILLRSTSLKNCNQRVSNLNKINANSISNINHVNGNVVINNNGNEEQQQQQQQDTVNANYYFGEFTREVYNAICLRLGDTLHIPEDSVQAIFNDMKLFPSKSQVSKMLQCARQCGRRNGSKDYLTFGEFCVFVREMQNQSPKQQRKISVPKINNKCTSKCEVFLGGSCNPTTWRADTAIPELQKHGISFYNPQVSIWAPELLAEEHDAKQSASVLLFVIDSQTRSTVGMLEVAYLVACGRCVVVVAQPYKKGQSIMGEIISDREYMDLVEGQNSLLYLVKSRGVKIHNNLPTALQCTANILRNTSNNGTSAEELITLKLRRLREVYDSYNGEMNLCNVFDAYHKLTNQSLEISKLYHYLGNQNVNKKLNDSISFERFCVLMAEFSSNDGCDMCTTDVWATQSFQRQCSADYTCNLTSTNHSCLVEENNHQNHTQNTSRTYDVFLGGSLTSTTNWRQEIAIPLLKKHGVEYYNPAMRENGYAIDDSNMNGSEEWGESVLEWKKVMDSSRVLLFVVSEDTRSLTTMILAAYCVGLGKEVVLCVQQLPVEECVVKNETLTKNATKDYNRARIYLRDLAERKQVPVFENVTDAVQCAITKCRDS